MLFRELLDVDFHFRRKIGETPRSEDYVSLFPTFQRDIESCLNETDKPVQDQLIIGREVESRRGILSSESLSTAREDTGRDMKRNQHTPELAIGTDDMGRHQSLPTTIGHYQILQKVGEGGMGVVYHAVDTRLKRPVALKLLKETKPELRKRFRREALAIASLNHPNICTIYDADYSDGDPFLAMEWLSGQLLHGVISGNPLPPTRLLKLAIRVARAALENDDTIAEAHVALGAVNSIFDHDWREAERCFNRAMELNPHYATAYVWYTWCVLLPMKRLNEAEVQAKLAVESDPVSSIGFATFGLVHQAKREHDKAIEVCQQALELEPDHPLPIACIADAFLAAGRNAEALAAYRQATISPLAVIGSAIVCSLTGDKKGMNKALSEQREAVDRGDSPLIFPLAKTFALLGMPELALEYLEMAYQERDIGLLLVETDRSFDTLRSDSRYQSIILQMGL